MVWKLKVWKFITLLDKWSWDHAINLKDNVEPILDCKIYPLGPGEQDELDAFLEENLSLGRIRPSQSKIVSPFFFIKKKDSRLRPVQDYRKLNEITIKNHYPLPLTHELINRVKGSKFFTKLDIRWRYNNIWIKEGDKWKAAFKTNCGMFEPLVMFSGLTNLPATFQTMMNNIFRDLINWGHVIIYLDDILIYTETMEEHCQMVQEVLDLLWSHKLYLKPEKCDWEKLEVKYLRHIILGSSVKMDPTKIKVISKWKEPRNKKELQSFLGFANYYRKFIEGYGLIVKPMTKLKGNEPWTWGSDQQKAFNQIKKQMITELILAIPWCNSKFKIEVDTSDYAKGAVLFQQQDNQWKTIAYMSNAMIPAEWNYEIADKELSVIITVLIHWHHYLMGVEEDFEIWTNHQNLMYFRSPQKLNWWQARWTQELSNYNFTLHHLPGEKNVWADTLSRVTGYDKGKLDNTGVTILKDQLFRGIKTEKEKLHIKRLCKEVKCPTRGSDEAAGWDLYSTEEKEILSRGHSLITTGISIAIPQGTYAWIAPRSGLVVKNMITTGAGVIDADYRGEVKVLLFNHGKQPFLIKNGD
jgi:deoxyuridine 5'-triphosphate nucleotidohydrolase